MHPVQHSCGNKGFKLWLAVILSFASLLPIPRTEANPLPPLAETLTSIRNTYQIPGMAIMVVSKDQIVATAVTGLRQRGQNVPMQISDTFQLGSCTKAMTATLLALLVEEHKLRWNSTLAEVFPTLNMHPDWRGVTLEQLLSHRSGAPENLDGDGLWQKLWERKGTPTRQRLELLVGVTRHPPLFRPGSSYLYSNAGVAIAGAMAERVTGLSWEDLMRQRLFLPLGMSSAGFGAPGSPGLLDQPSGHKADGTPVPPGPNSDNPPAIGPAATIHANLADWSRFLRLHLTGPGRGWVFQGKTLISATTFQKMHTPMGNDYALGWMVLPRPWAGGIALTHSGTNTYFYVVCWLAPAKQAMVLAATNQGGESSQKALDEAAWAGIQKFL